jgi:HK97 family phage portal protein
LGLFSKIFGNGNANKATQTFKLISSSNNYFSPWSGDVWQNDIVRACIRPKSDAIGKLNPKHIEGSEENIKVNDRPQIREVLENPNPYMSMQDFLSKMVIQRELNHNAFAYIDRNETKINAIYPIPVSRSELVESKSNELYMKLWFRTGKYVVVPYEDVIHLRKDFNEHDIFGDGHYQALQNLMEVITNTDNSVINAIKNGAIIRWLLKFKSAIRPEDKQVELEKFVDNYLSIENEIGAAATDPKFDAEQVEPNDYVPNAAQMDRSIKRLYAYFGVNESIVMNNYDEDEWNSFYESEIEPIAIQLSNAFTNVFFTKRERGYGNRIIFEASNLQYASMKTKLNLLNMVDRGALTPNEWRKVMNLGPIKGGDEPVRRLDTAPVEGGEFVDDDTEEDEE